MAIQVGLMLLRLVPFRRYEVITSVVAPTAQAAQETFGHWMMWLDNVGGALFFWGGFQGVCFLFRLEKVWILLKIVEFGGFSFLKVFGVETQKEFSTDSLKRSTIGQIPLAKCRPVYFLGKTHTSLFLDVFFRINEINEGVSSPGNKPFMLDAHNLPM